MKELKKNLKEKTRELELEKKNGIEKTEKIIKLGYDWSTSEAKKQYYYDLWQIELGKNTEKVLETHDIAKATQNETMYTPSETQNTARDTENENSLQAS